MEAVGAPLFAGGGFFLASDKVQVKYEMLRAHLVDGVNVTDAAAAHGYSRAGFYVVQAAFERAGMTGLIDERRGRRGPVKLTAEIAAFLRGTGGGVGADSWSTRWRTDSGCVCIGAPWNGPVDGERPALAYQIGFWPVGEAAQADYETLRQHVLDRGALPDSLAAARFARRGLAGLIAWPAAEPIFSADLVGANRPPWSPHEDPRLGRACGRVRRLAGRAATQSARHADGGMQR